MSLRRMLITGGTGLLGKHLLETAPAGWTVFATSHHRPPPDEWLDRFLPLELCDAASIQQVFESVRPSVVIHTASIGSVDEAECHPELAHAVNVEGTQVIGNACVKYGSRLVFISSNAVFDGRHPPYDEAAPLQAVNRYGVLKIEAERWIRQDGPPHALVIRPLLLYGWPLPGGRDNTVTRWLRQLEAGRSVEAAEDIYSMPLYAENCSQAIWAAVRQRRTGTYHVAGADHLSLLAFARLTARAFGYDERRVAGVTSARLGMAARRPTDTSFVTVKMERELGVRPLGVAEGLAIMQERRAAAVPKVACKSC